MKSRPETNPRSEAGFALVATLWGIIIISLIAASVAGLVRSTSIGASGDAWRLQAQYAAEGAVNLAVLELSQGLQSGRDIRSTKSYQIAGFNIEVEIENEASRIGLAAVSPEILRAMFEWAGQSGEDARALADAVLDWQDKDDVARRHGAEALDYRGLGKLGRPRNGRFASLGELMRVRGITSEIVTCIAPVVSIYSERSPASEARAKPAVWKIIQMASGGGGSGQSILNPNAASSGPQLYRVAVRVKDKTRVLTQTTILRLERGPDRPLAVLAILPGSQMNQSACSSQNVQS